MKIACHIGDDGDLADFFQPGRLHVFAQDGGAWVSQGEFPIDLGDACGIAALKERLRSAIQPLDSPVFLLKDLRGVFRALLEEFGFRVLTSKGSLQEQLSDAAVQDREAREAQEAADSALPAPTLLSDGHYQFDLFSLLQAGDCHASRDMLLPFLETVTFQSLEVICDHVPRWLGQELGELGMVFTAPEGVRPGETMTVRITPAEGEWSQPPGRRPGRAGCQCGG
nr:Fe-only nitrogenase accessory protein AnfO [uncultured Holophaga sp.]